MLCILRYVFPADTLVQKIARACLHCLVLATTHQVAPVQSRLMLILFSFLSSHPIQDGQLCCMYSTNCLGNVSLVAAQGTLHNRESITEQGTRKRAAGDASWKSLGHISESEIARRTTATTAAATTTTASRIARRHRLLYGHKAPSTTARVYRRTRVLQRMSRTGPGGH
ncbi:unnamed protein product [Ixodes persulcatus]